MPVELKRTVADLEVIPEGFRGLYKEAEEGGFSLQDDFSIEGMISKSDYEGLIKNKETILGEKKKLEEMFAGIDPKKARAYQKELEAKERDAQKLAGDFDAREQALTIKHAEEIKGLKDNVSGLQASLEKQMIDSSARSALAAARAKSVGGVNLLLPHIKQRVKIVEDNGSHKVVVVGDDGRPRIAAKNGTAAPMTVEDLIAEMRDSDEFSVCFEADNKAGSGASGTGGGGAPTYTRDQLRQPGIYAQAMKEAEQRGEKTPRIKTGD